MTRLHLAVAIALAGCAPVNATPQTDVTVELSAVTLGDQCNTAGPPPVQPPAPATPAVVATPARPAAECEPPGCGLARRGGCNQTSMQLAVRAAKTAKPTTIRVKTVELLDPKGKVLEVLTARSPTQWTDRGYVTWDQSVAANQTLATSYVLTTPNWDKLTGGRWHAHEKTFQLRVTVTIGTATRTIEKQSITPAILPPAVPT